MWSLCIHVFKPSQLLVFLLALNNQDSKDKMSSETSEKEA